MLFKLLKTDVLNAQSSAQEMTHKADRFMLFILWAHTPVAGFFVPYYYGTWKEGLIASLFINIIGTISYFISRGSFGHRLLNGLLLLSYSIVLISIQYGRIEMHFHVFASLPFLILYRDWRIIPPAALLVATHHAVFNYCQANNIDLFGFPLIVFNYGTGWDIVFLHAVFVVFQSAVLIYYSELLKRQHKQVVETNKSLEEVVNKRTQRLKEEIETIRAYKKTLDQVASTALLDIDGKILDINQQFEHVSGYSREEILGENFSIIKSNDRSGKSFKDVHADLKQGQVWRGEIKSLAKTGEPFWSEIAIAPVRNIEGNVTQFMSIKFDTTEKKKNEATILKQREQIVSQAKLSSLGEMAGGIAHEINNPLTIISGTAHSMKRMIKKGMMDAELFNDAISDIDSTVTRITKIVSGLRNISRNSSEEAKDLCFVRDIIEDVMPLCAAKFKNYEIDFSIVVDEKLENKKVRLHRVQLSQVLLNLLTNAFDEISDNHDLTAKWIKLSIKEENEKLVFRVTDCGHGVPKEIQEKIFQPFFTTKDIGKGTGLGLSLSHSIITGQEGRLYIDNESTNTSFVIELPLTSEA